MIADYSCKNFEEEAENKKFMKEKLLANRETLPLGEFAIGTNTTAYVAAKKLGIEDVLPILIAEKTGPHFAIGDTCYSMEEDVVSYNPNGKQIMAELSDSYDVSFFDTATLAALESTGSINAENALAFDDIAAVTVHYDYSYNFDKYTGIVSDYGTLGEYGERVVRVEETKSSEIFNGKLFTDEEDIKTLFGYLTDRNVVNIFDGGTYVFFSIEFTYNGGRKAGYSLYDSVENLHEILHYLKEYIPLER